MSKAKMLGRLAFVVMFVASTAMLTGAGDHLTVVMRGPCDPASFNAAVGPGTCIGNGEITFAHFISELTAAKKVGAWNFTPTQGSAEAGAALSLENHGGETHTFTKVKEFGGGFIAPLNALSGTPVPAPECATATVGGLIPKPESPSNIFVEADTTEAGPTIGSAIIPSGQTTKFQCCIHPWMRMEVTAK